MVCRARNISSCHLVDLTAAAVTSLVWIRSRTFFGNALIIAEMLIIQTCPVLLNQRFFFFFNLRWKVTKKVYMQTGSCRDAHQKTHFPQTKSRFTHLPKFISTETSGPLTEKVHRTRRYTSSTCAATSPGIAPSVACVVNWAQRVVTAWCNGITSLRQNALIRPQQPHR